MALFAEVGVVKCLAVPRARNLVTHTLVSMAFSSEEQGAELQTRGRALFTVQQWCQRGGDENRDAVLLRPVLL
ncbi:hypothetical protein Q3G72_016128 [Acer saccharum]|nr:hypothetical protein Q3G72_016128 [Acer saccharum]